MKAIVVFNAIGLCFSSAANWLLIQWTRDALVLAPQGALPLPGFTLAVFNQQKSLAIPTVAIVIAAIILMRADKVGSKTACVVSGFTLFAIILMSAVVSMACVLPWFAKIPWV